MILAENILCVLEAVFFKYMRHGGRTPCSLKVLLRVKYYFLLLVLLPRSFLQILFIEQIHFSPTVALSDGSVKSSFSHRIEVCTYRSQKGTV